MLAQAAVNAWIYCRFRCCLRLVRDWDYLRTPMTLPCCGRIQLQFILAIMKGCCIVDNVEVWIVQA
jgi:hypothetical protein